jgi:hypothetical protein
MSMAGEQVATGQPLARAEARCRLLALAPNSWDGQWMNRQQILSRLGAHHDVLYSTGAWSVWDRAARLPARHRRR